MWQAGMPGPGETLVNQKPLLILTNWKSNVCVCEPTSLFRMCSPPCFTCFITQTPFASLQCLQSWPPKHKNDAHSVCVQQNHAAQTVIFCISLGSTRMLNYPNHTAYVRQRYCCKQTSPPQLSRKLKKMSSVWNCSKEMNFHKLEWEETIYWIGKWFGGTLM